MIALQTAHKLYMITHTPKCFHIFPLFSPLRSLTTLGESQGIAVKGLFKFIQVLSHSVTRKLLLGPVSSGLSSLDGYINWDPSFTITRSFSSHFPSPYALFQLIIPHCRKHKNRGSYLIFTWSHFWGNLSFFISINEVNNPLTSSHSLYTYNFLHEGINLLWTTTMAK